MVPFNQLRVCVHGLVSYANIYVYISCLDVPEVGQENVEKPYRQKGEDSLQLVGLRKSPGRSRQLLKTDHRTAVAPKFFNAIGLITPEMEFGRGYFAILGMTSHLVLLSRFPCVDNVEFRGHFSSCDVKPMSFKSRQHVFLHLRSGTLWLQRGLSCKVLNKYCRLPLQTTSCLAYPNSRMERGIPMIPSQS